MERLALRAAIYNTGRTWARPPPMQRLPFIVPLSRVHDVQTELEIRFKTAAPQLFRVLIHPEPQTDNRR